MVSNRYAALCGRGRFTGLKWQWPTQPFSWQVVQVILPFLRLWSAVRFAITGDIALPLMQHYRFSVKGIKESFGVMAYPSLRGRQMGYFGHKSLVLAASLCENSLDLKWC